MSHEFNKRMTEILGLSEETIWFELRCEVNKRPIITSEQYVIPHNIINDDRVETVLKRYEIVEKEEHEVNIVLNGDVAGDLDKVIDEALVRACRDDRILLIADKTEGNQEERKGILDAGRSLI